MAMEKYCAIRYQGVCMAYSQKPRENTRDTTHMLRPQKKHTRAFESMILESGVDNILLLTCMHSSVEWQWPPPTAAVQYCCLLLVVLQFRIFFNTMHARSTSNEPRFFDSAVNQPLYYCRHVNQSVYCSRSKE